MASSGRVHAKHVAESMSTNGWILLAISKVRGVSAVPKILFLTFAVFCFKLKDNNKLIEIGSPTHQNPLHTCFDIKP